MDTKGIRAALRDDRILMCTYKSTGSVYSLDNGVPVPKKLAAQLEQPLGSNREKPSTNS